MTRARPRPARRARRLWGCLRWTVGIGVGGIALSAVAIGGTYAWLRSAAGQEWIRAQAESALSASMSEGDARIGRLSTNLLTRASVEDVTLRDGAGRPVLSVAQADVRLRPLALLGWEVHAPEVAARGVLLDLRIDEAGLDDFSKMFASDAPPAEGPWQGLPIAIRLPDIAVEAPSLSVQAPDLDVSVRDLRLGAAFYGRGRRLHLQRIELGGAMVAPEPGPLSVGGEILWEGLGLEAALLEIEALRSRVVVQGSAPDLFGDDGEVDLLVRVDALPLSDVDAFVGAGLAGAVEGELRARGPAESVAVGGLLAGRDGTDLRVGVAVEVNLQTGSFDGNVSVDSLRVDHLLPAIGEPLPVAAHVQARGHTDDSSLGFTAMGRLSDGRAEVSGIIAERIESGLSLEDGVLLLKGLMVSGPIGRVDGEGGLDLQTGALDLALRLADIDPVVLAHLGVPEELSGTRAAGRARVGAGLYDPVLPVRVDGEIIASPLYWTPEIRVGRAVADLGLDLIGTTGELTARLDATAYGIVAYGAEIERVVASDVSVAVTEELADVRAQLEIRQVRYEVVPEELREELGEGARFAELNGSLIVRSALQEGVDVRMDPDPGLLASEVGEGSDGVLEGPSAPSPGPVALDLFVDLDVGEHRLLKFDGADGRIAARLADDEVRALVLLDAPDQRRLVDARVGVDLSRLAIDLERVVLAPTATFVAKADPGGRLRIADDGAIEDLNVVLRSNRGRFGVSGRVLGERPQELDIDLYDVDLALLGELGPSALRDLSGYGGAFVEVRGDPEALELSGRVDAMELEWRERDDDGAELSVIRDLALGLTLEGRADSIALVGLVSGLGRPLLDVDVAVPVRLSLSEPGLLPEGPLRADLGLVPGRFRRLEAFVPAITLPEGSGSGRLRARGTVARPEVRWAGVAEMPVEGLDLPARFETFIDLTARDVFAEVDVRDGHHLQAELRGGGRTRLGDVIDWALLDGPEPPLDDLDTWLSALFGGLRLTGVSVRRIAELIGVPLDADGSVYGNVALAGSLARPRPNGRVEIRNGRLGGVDLTLAELDLQSDDDGFGVGVDVGLRDRRTGAEGELYVDGAIPLAVDLSHGEPKDWVRGPLDLRIAGEVPLAVLSAFDSGFRDLSGALLLTGVVEGSPLDPEPSAGLMLTRDSRIGYETVGVRLSEMVLGAYVDRDSVALACFSAITQPLDPGRSQLGLIGAVGAQVREGFGLFRRSGGRAARRAERQRAAEALASAPACPGGVQGELARGEIRAEGEAELDEWSLIGLNLGAALDRAVVLHNPDQVLRLSTQAGRPLRVTGEAAFPSITGGVRVEEADFYLDYATASGGAPLEVDPRIQVNRAGRTYRTPDPPDSVLDDVAVDVQIDLGRAARGRLSMPIESMGFLGQATTALTRVDLGARLGGDLVFRQLPCRRRDEDGRPVPIPGRAGRCGLFHPQIEGIVQVLEGQARVFRADFTLVDSSVSFFGAEVYDPNLDVKGKMQAGEVTIDMTIGGSALQPDVNFSSADTDQVFATLLLGTSPDALGSQGASQLAFAAAMTAFQSVLSGANLGTFSIQPSGAIAWGLAVARDLYVEGTIGGTPRPDINTFEVQAEYTLTQGLIGRVGFGAYAIPFWSDLLIERRFDGPKGKAATQEASAAQAPELAPQPPPEPAPERDGQR